MLARGTAVALLLASPSLAAGGFDARRVGGDATWVLHVDFEALSRSSFLRALHREGLHVENDLDLDHVRTRFGLEPFSHLRSMTMYGAGPRGGVVTVVEGTAEIEAAWQRLRKEGEVLPVGGRAALRLGEGRSSRFAAIAGAQEATSRTAVLATGAEGLAFALAVLGGERPHLGASPRAPGSGPAFDVAPGEGSLVFAASAPGARVRENVAFFARALSLLAELAGLEGDRRSSFEQLVRGIEFELCETRGEVYARLSVDAASGPEADKLGEILNGSVAALESAGGPPEVAGRRSELLASLKVASPASRLVVTYRYPAERFVADLLLVERGGAGRPGR